MFHTLANGIFWSEHVVVVLAQPRRENIFIQFFLRALSYLISLHIILATLRLLHQLIVSPCLGSIPLLLLQKVSISRD